MQPHSLTNRPESPDPEASRRRTWLACLGDPSRFAIARCLIESELCVSSLAQRIALSQSCTTRHLQTMLRCELVHRRRDGKQVLLRLRTEDPALSEVLDWLIRAEGHGVSAARAVAPGKTGQVKRRRVRTQARPARPAPESRSATELARSSRDGASELARSSQDGAGDFRAASDSFEAPDFQPRYRRRRNDLEDFLL